MFFKRTEGLRRLLMLPVEELLPNDSQPRKHFDPDALNSLSESIRINGIIQPLCVRRLKDGSYILISGERRLRAAQMAGLKLVPCVLTNADERSAALLALVENLQREDLSCFEEAEGIFKLISIWGVSREEAAERLGIAQSTLSNKLRLLRLTPWQRERIEAARLSERHARALLRIDDEQRRDDVLLSIIARGLNVTETDELINEIMTPKAQEAHIPQRRMVIGDIRLFANTINNAVDTMRRSGVNANCEKSENERFIEYKIVIPKLYEEDKQTRLIEF